MTDTTTTPTPDPTPVPDAEPPGDNRPAAYWELDGQVIDGPALDDDAILVVRASALGKCMWELAAMLQGHEPEPVPPTILRAFRDGHDAEDIILGRLYDELGWVRVEGHAQTEHELWVGPNRVVRFHPDDVGCAPHALDYKTILEAKALSQENFTRAVRYGPTSLPYGYGWQASVMMLAMRLPLVFALGEKEPRRDGDEDSPVRIGNLATKHLQTPPHSFAEIVKRVRDIHALACGEDLTTSKQPCEKPDQWPCLYRRLRPEPTPTAKPLPDVPAEHAEEFLAHIRAYRQGAAVEKRGKEMKEGARASLVELARLMGTEDGMQHDGRRVSISTTFVEPYTVKGGERTTVTIKEAKQ